MARVVKALRDWEFGLTAKELMEDTGLSHWDVRQAVAELRKQGTITAKRELRPSTTTSKWCTAYLLKQP